MLAIVNSPSTTVAVRNDDETIADCEVGDERPAERGAPAGAEAARGVDEGAHVDGADAGVDRAVRERQREHDVERDEREVGVEEPAGVRPEDAGTPATSAIGGTTYGRTVRNSTSVPASGSRRCTHSAVGSSSANVSTTVPRASLRLSHSVG